MTVARDRLAPQERRASLAAPMYRLAGTPITVALGLLNTAIVVRETGAAVFGLVALVATVTLLFPFADLGIGASVISASARLRGPNADPAAADVVRRGFRVLLGVAGAVVVVAVVIMSLDGWATVIGFASGPQDRWAVTVAVCLFGMTLPAGLGVRILIGIDRNPLATVVLMSCPAFALGLTLLLFSARVDGIWYVTSSLGGLLAGQLLGCVLALRLSGLGSSAFSPVRGASTGTPLLAGSMWLFVVGLGLPIGLQTGRVILAHLSTPEQLAEYSLLAQMYAACWSVLSAAGLAYWPIFVRRRTETAETIAMWRRLTTSFAALAALAAAAMWLLGPWAAEVLSGGEIEVTAWLALAFGALLIGQAMHLPATVLLTLPAEARWQAFWTIVMAVASIGLGCAVAPGYGAVGVVVAAALAIVVAQVVPALIWVPELVRRRRPYDEVRVPSPAVRRRSRPDPRRG
ncbi:lipopolysaccharide biosynthesis protein [Mycolicibacterium lacusdiani]|uniref:lipopolysaccharide biosynthesis protein n=1 Tax=Mycolicibacterium lacusdiani TaxID=2895283 RepID=UPI001F0193A5|nr:oligosaccharide flippase family protein [Mycolicibacterium lacusdiani]